MKPTTDRDTGTDGAVAAPPATSEDNLYRAVFEHVPVSLWEEDASEIKAYLEELRSSSGGGLNTYLDYHPEVVADCAGMVRVLAVNAATVKLFEAKDAAELLGNLDKLLCEESYEGLKEVVLAIADGRNQFEIDTYNRTMNGLKKHVLMRFTVAPGCEESYERVWISMLDLTEHELFAKELDDTGKRYRMFAEYVNDVIWIMDMGMNFTFVSPSVERTLGYTVDEVLEMQYQDLLTPASLEIAMEAVVEELAPDAMRNRDPRRSRVLELEFKTRGGSTLWGELNISFMLDKGGIPKGIVGVIRDVTDRHAAGEAIERSWQAQKVINDVLKVSLEDINRDEMLQRMLSRILEVPWFTPEARGGILLLDRVSDSLVMTVESGLANEVVKACARRRVGECFCGSAAASGQIMYRAGGGGAGDRRCQPEGACSQYCVPFSSSGGLLGVLNLYLADGHACSEKEMEFLSAVGGVLASSIERKQATETLRKSEAAHRAIFDKASDSIFIHDPETARILDVNSQTCETFGYSHDEMLNLSVGDISGGDKPFSQEDAVRLVRKAANEGPQLFEWHCRNRSGRLFWVEVNLSFAELRDGDRVLAFVRDIDARKRAEQRALALSNFLEGIMDTVDIWISAADRDANIILWNGAAERISGYSRDDVLGNSGVWERMYPDEKIRLNYMEERCKLLRSGVPCDRHRSSIITKSGESRIISWNSYGLVDEKGEVCGALALAFDVTDDAKAGDCPSDIEEHVIRALRGRDAS